MTQRMVQTQLTLLNWSLGNAINERNFTDEVSSEEPTVLIPPPDNINVSAVSNPPSGYDVRRVGVSPSGLDVFEFVDDEDVEDADENVGGEDGGEVAGHAGGHAIETNFQTNLPDPTVEQVVDALQVLQINVPADDLPENDPAAALPATRVYSVHSHLLQGTSIEWSEAGAATQGARAHGNVRREAGPVKQAQGYDAFVVYRGHRHGLCHSMPEVLQRTTGFFGSVYEGYFDLDYAGEMHRFAKERGWLACDGADFDANRYPYTPPIPVPDDWDPAFGRQVGYLEELEAILRRSWGLYPGVRKWYIVTVGVQPGIYLSLIESQLNVIGVRGAIHHHEPSLELARRFFQSAVQKNNVLVRNAPLGRRLQGRDF